MYHSWMQMNCVDENFLRSQGERLELWGKTSQCLIRLERNVWTTNYLKEKYRAQEKWTRFMSCQSSEVWIEFVVRWAVEFIIVCTHILWNPVHMPEPGQRCLTAFVHCRCLPQRRNIQKYTLLASAHTRSSAGSQRLDTICSHVGFILQICNTHPLGSGFALATGLLLGEEWMCKCVTGGIH